MPFSMELQVLDEAPSTVLDTTSFVTTPFTLDDVEMDTLEVPITDTRQQQQQQQSSDKNVQTGVNVNAGLNTLNSISVSNVELDDDNDGDCDETKTLCCSRFKVLDKCASSKKHSVVSSTLTSPKLNSVNVSRQMNDTLLSNNNANGLLSQFGLDGE